MTVPAILLAPPTLTKRRFTLIDAAGAEHSLNGESGIWVGDGVRGLWMPPTTIGRMSLPLVSGAWLTNVRLDEREIELPLVMQADTAAGLHQLKRDTIAWLCALGGELTLRVTAPDGSEHEIGCYYADQMGMDESSQAGGTTWQRAAVTLLAVDPYWRDADGTEVTFSIGEGSVPFLPYAGRPGFYLVASSLYASKSVANTGDVEAEPIWTIEGPGVNPTFRNLTTGKVLTLTLDIHEGSTVTIDTRERAIGYAIRDQDGNNLLAAAATPPQLWTLARGENVVRVEMAGAVDGTSSVTMAYRNRFLGP